MASSSPRHALEVGSTFFRSTPGTISAPPACGLAIALPRMVLLLLSSVVLTAGPLRAQAPPPPPSVGELKRLTVEELMEIEVTSVSRAAERLGGAAAAVTVITNEDIRRSGATVMPELLRQVPGIHVARQDASTWAVSSRGFSSVNSEKLLVLSDTRSVYTPLFSGVMWDVQNYLLQDIERIEVVRGPGATLWGSNAVNGVINLTTKHARDTQGLYVETSAGTEERVATAARYGGRIADRTYYRLFAKYSDRDATFVHVPESPDDWQIGHMGVRVDHDATSRDSLTFQGDVYQSDIGQLAPSVTIIGRPGAPPPLRVSASGGNVLARWKRTLSPDSDVQLRVYYDRTHRNDPSFTDDLDTFDADVQHRIGGTRQHEVTWGGNYRITANTNHGKGVFAVDPARADDHLIGGFIQDQIRLGQSLRVTIGSKVEHNGFSGFEVQPSGRVAWDALPDHTIWGAVSRAVRVPTRLERDIAIDVTDPAGDPVVRLLGNPDFDSERLLAYEAGYRWQALRSLSADVAAFYNRYNGLASLELGDPFSGRGRTIIPLQNQNLTAGRALGVEALITFAPLPVWRMTGTYAHVNLHLDPAGADLNRGKFLEGSTPRHQFGLRSLVDLPKRFQFDAQFRQVTEIRSIPAIVTGEGLPGFAELDLRLAWDGWKQLELSVVGQNLLHDHHAEFGPPEARGEIERGVYGKIAWGF